MKTARRRIGKEGTSTGTTPRTPQKHMKNPSRKKKPPANNSIMQEQNFSVSEFKKHCLALFEKIQHKGEEILITKHGEPIAMVIPLRKEHQPLRGSMKGQLMINGDIVECDWSEGWEALR